MDVSEEEEEEEVEEEGDVSNDDEPGMGASKYKNSHLAIGYKNDRSFVVYTPATNADQA
jgi:hypothetical protein